MSITCLSIEVESNGLQSKSHKKINDKKVRHKRRKPMNRIKVAFLDRDGTITKEYEDEEWKNKTIPGFGFLQLQFSSFV